MDDVRRLDGGREDAVFSLDELAREGARRMIAAALEAEVAAFARGLPEGVRMTLGRDSTEEDE